MEIAMIKEIQFHRAESPGGIASSPCLTMRVGPGEVTTIGDFLAIAPCSGRQYWTLVPLSQVTLHGDVPALPPKLAYTEEGPDPIWGATNGKEYLAGVGEVPPEPPVVAQKVGDQSVSLNTPAPGKGKKR